MGVNIMKNKVYIFGAGQTGIKISKELERKGVIIQGFLDNNSLKHGDIVEGYEVKGDASYLKEDSEWDEIVIGSLPGYRVMNEQLISVGVDYSEINESFVEMFVLAREHFLRDYALINKEKFKGLSVAEGGVFQGEFAKVINQNFPESKLFLFDTFTGFDNRDVCIEEEQNFSKEKAGHFATTSKELVMRKMPYPDLVDIREGYFPDTAKGINDTFCFVNLDFDLYQPILSGLQFFYPKMADNSVILIHDYFNYGYPGVKQAVVDFEREVGELVKFPIGDSYSIAIMKR